MHPERRVETAGALLRQARERSSEDVGAKLPSDPELVVRINAGAQVAGGVLLALGRARAPPPWCSRRPWCPRRLSSRTSGRRRTRSEKPASAMHF
nr:hypothetical protein [Nocardia crassostreae]